MNELIVLQRGRTRLTVAPRYGGRIAQIELLDGRTWLPLLHDDTRIPIDARDPLAWGCFPMAPWPNRIAGGRFEFDGRSYSLPVNDGKHALHGLTFDRPWDVVKQEENLAVMQLSLVGSAWPWHASCSHSISVFDDGLSLEIEVRSTDEATFPAGVGWHPWFRRDVRPGHDVRLQIDSDRVYELSAMIPTGRLLPVDELHDMREYPRLGERRIDACYSHPREAPRIRWGDVELTMQSSANVDHVVVYTPAQAVCIEPQTCAIDAFNIAAGRHDRRGMVELVPGGVLRATGEWHWTIGGT